MALRKIRWKEADYKKLHQAVNRFNRELKKAGENLDYMPNPISYKEVKAGIFTRKGLNDTIKSLDRLNKENASNVVRTEQGLRISEYEWNEIKRADRINKIRLGKEYKKISTPLEGEAGSRLQMGGESARRIEQNLKRDNIKRLMEARDTTEFQQIQQAIMNRASEDIRYKKTLQWKENYMEILRSRYSTFENYDKLYNKVKDMSPDEFLRFMKANDLTEDLTYQSDQYYSQVEFNSYLQDLGFNDLEDPNEAFIGYSESIEDIVNRTNLT